MIQRNPRQLKRKARMRRKEGNENQIKKGQSSKI
jgi:hypothetical protein